MFTMSDVKYETLMSLPLLNQIVTDLKEILFYGHYEDVVISLALSTLDVAHRGNTSSTHQMFLRAPKQNIPQMSEEDFFNVFFSVAFYGCLALLFRSCLRCMLRVSFSSLTKTKKRKH